MSDQTQHTEDLAPSDNRHTQLPITKRRPMTESRLRSIEWTSAGANVP